MNNRKIFINFINSLFEPYKKEFENTDKNVSCDTLGQGGSDNFSLLTHQKIVRQFLVYRNTPSPSVQIHEFGI